MFKKIINIFAVIFGLSLFSILTYTFYKNTSKNLSEYSLIESNVIDKGITKSKNDKDIFYLKLSNIEKKFSNYSMTQNYNELNNQIKIGDNIKIYFEDSNYVENKYLEIIQLEKKNQILINHNKHKLIYYGLTFLGLLANIYILLMLFEYLKYGKFDNPIPPIF